MQNQTTSPAAPAPSPSTTGEAPKPETKTNILMDSKQIAGKAVVWAEEYGPPVVGVIILLAAAWAAAGLRRRGVRKGLERARFDPTLGKFISNMVRWLVLALAVMACLEVFGVKTTGFAALIGAAGLAIGLGFQGSLANLAAGVMLLVFRPFKVGDAVVVGGMTGIVHEIDLFTTCMDTPDGRRIIMPNGQIFGSTIENSTFHAHRRADVGVTISGEADIDATRRALERAASSAEGGLPEPAPAVVLVGLAAAGVEWSVQVWGPTADLPNLKQALIRAVKTELDRAGIAGGRAQMDLHVKGAGGENVIRVIPREGAKV